MKPIVKWTGGKRKLLNKLRSIVSASLEQHGCTGGYIEPFVGGGALYLDILETKAKGRVIISDVNLPLMCMYRSIRDQPEPLITRLKELSIEVEDAKTEENRTEVFNKHKHEFNVMKKGETLETISDLDRIELSALFVFLNKMCFNGIYRENSKGEFNVTYNKKSKFVVDDDMIDNIMKQSVASKEVEMYQRSYSEVIKNATRGDLVYMDPPYVPIDKKTKETFARYNAGGFKEHREVLSAFKELDERGCFVFMSNHNTPCVVEELKEYNIYQLAVRHDIRAKGGTLQKEKNEVIITNFKSE